ncbi:hypothetical protein D3C80_1348830 [compost metagenome]
MYAQLGPADQQGMRHVVAVADVGELEAFELAFMLIDRLIVGQHLARMRQIAQAVDYGNRSEAGQLLHLIMTEGTDHNAVKVTGHHLSRVSNGLAAAKLDVIFAQEQRMAAELIHADLEGHACAGRGFFKDKSDCFAFQRLVNLTVLLLLLQLYSQINQIRDFLRAVIVQLQQITAFELLCDSRLIALYSLAHECASPFPLLA